MRRVGATARSGARTRRTTTSAGQSKLVLFLLESLETFFEFGLDVLNAFVERAFESVNLLFEFRNDLLLLLDLSSQTSQFMTLMAGWKHTLSSSVERVDSRS